MTSRQHHDAALLLVDRAVVNSPQFRARELLVSREKSDPDIIRFMRAFTKDCKDRGYPIFCISLYRGRDEQNAIHDRGASKARFGSSPHNFGMAGDFVHFGKWWGITNAQWSVLGALGKEAARRLNLKMVWGGDWRFYDPAHWELADWKIRAASMQLETGLTIPFATAFSQARKAGLDQFTWNGKRYSTDIA